MKRCQRFAASFFFYFYFGFTFLRKALLRCAVE